MSCYQFDKVSIVTARQDTIKLQFAQTAAVTDDYNVLLDKVTVHNCLREVNDYLQRASVSHDDEETDRVLVSITQEGRLKKTITVTGTQLSTIGQYYEINRCIKVVKDTMDWVLALPPFDALAIPGGFDEFVASTKVLRPLAMCTIEN
ncbi:unnamed protein product [Phytophthora lilii]|uniref:Unnamed protein product n=1 Tax=Phytophthora lilii TaxID=2077276 RepID=A0A9W6TIZ7_9STRA|nr:unnamed protein product [Phytophthora lilii]